MAAYAQVLFVLGLEKDAMRDEEILKWIDMLIAPGASLGGARHSVVKGWRKLAATLGIGNDEQQIMERRL